MTCQDYKEMEYQATPKRELLDSGTCFGLEYYIMSLGTHPTAYVRIPVDHWLYKATSIYDIPIECHGGITYCGDHLLTSETEKLNGTFIGWDYAHCDDYVGFWPNDGFRNDSCHKWTTEEIREEVRRVCSQIIELKHKGDPNETKD